MNTKLKSFFVLLSVILGGVSSVWADSVYEYTCDPALNTDNYFTVSKGEEEVKTYKVSISLEGSSTTITKAVKMESATTITFTTTATNSTVYVGLYARYAATDDSSNNQFKLDDTVYTASNSTTAGSNEIVIISNVGDGAHTLKQNKKEVEIYYIKVVEHNGPSLSGPDTYVQTYPYTWDFTASSSGWTTSETQMTTTYSDWVGSGTYYHQDHDYGSYPVGYNIEVIRGLRFSRNYLGLDWGYGHIWFAQGSIVIPDLEAGQTITIVMEGRDETENTTLNLDNATGDNYTITKSDGNHQTYTYTVTADGDVTLNFNHAVSIRSIAVTAKKTPFGVRFRSQEGYVTVGKTITPFVKVPNGDWSDFTSVTVTTADANIAKVSAGENGTAGSSVTLTKENGGVKIDGGALKAIYPTIHGVAVGNTTITLTLESTKYETTTITYTIHVTNNELNFDWATLGDGKTTVIEYTLYTGDYMMVPAIAGTANGNWDYSKGTTCETKQAYLYGMRANSPIWNNADFKLGGGYPNYRLTGSNAELTTVQKSSMTNVTDKAYIVWASSQKSDEDTLMVYGHTKGVVWLHAFDSQTGAELAPIKITILDKAEKLVNSTASYVSTMSYPYTWDFTTDFTVTATPNYWEPVYRNGTLSYYTCGYSTMFNWDYCDQDNDENINEALGNTVAASDENKYFVGANADQDMAGVMPQFYGLTIFSGNSGDTNTKSYESKRDKLRIEAFRQEGLPRLDVVGGIHRIRLPNAATVMPGQETFKLVVKAVPTGDKCTIYKFKNGDHATSGQGTATWKEITGESIVMFDVNATEITGDNYIELGVDNVKIYWIAMSTEAKTINPAAGATGDNIEMMASYSYDKAMDYAKSAEVNGVDAYVASGLTWNDQARNLTVTMRKNNTQVPTRTGVVLRAQNKASSKTWTFEGLSNDKDANNNSGTDYITKFTIDGLTCELNKFGFGKVEDCSVTVGDNSYTKCLNLLGKGGSIGHRYFSLSVSGPTTISIDCQPQDASKGNKLFVGYGSAVGGATAITTHTLSSGAATYTCDYTGGSTTIFIYGTEGTGTGTTDSDKTGTNGYGIKVYGITTTDKGTSAYMIADAQNEAGYTAPSAPASNYLLSTWATDVERPTLYRNAGNETGTTSGETHIPFIFSDRYTKTSTGNQHHDAGYFSFWRIKSNQITAGKNMAYIVLDKATYGNAANANGKADDITATMSSSDSRMAIRFVDDDDPFGDLTGISVVESEGVSESAPQQGDGYYYDLRGRRVDTPVRGLYIHNGRKVLVK